MKALKIWISENGMLLALVTFTLAVPFFSIIFPIAYFCGWLISWEIFLIICGAVLILLPILIWISGRIIERRDKQIPKL